MFDLSSIQNHDHSVEGDLANANSAQTVLYFFLLHPHVTYFDYGLLFFFHNFYSLLTTGKNTMLI
jgi:hypothetical protein